MFEDDGEGGLTAMHHPFTSAKDFTPEQLKSDPESAVANAYDMVLNGYEVGGGSVRIHNSTMQQVVFGILGINEQEQREKFGFLLDALKFGTPPHAGIAFGLDRLNADDRNREHSRRYRFPENDCGGLSANGCAELC